MEPLVIERERVVSLAMELAKLRNVPVAEAVEEALRDRLGRERERQAYIGRVNASAAAVRESLREPLTHNSINDMLYGPDGLPG